MLLLQSGALLSPHRIHAPEASDACARLSESTIHENEYVYETRWEDGEDIVTNVILKKENDKIWRSIVNRMPKNR